MKTAMQELISLLEAKEKEYDDKMKNHNLDSVKCGLIADAYLFAKKLATSLLEKEKQQLQDAYNIGNDDCSSLTETYKDY